jgi:hypothetical protein
LKGDKKPHNIFNVIENINPSNAKIQFLSKKFLKGIIIIQKFLNLKDYLLRIYLFKEYLNINLIQIKDCVS